MKKGKNIVSRPKLFKVAWKCMMVLFAAVAVGCNQDYPNLLNQDYPDGNQPADGKNNKVLLVTIEGLKGTTLTAVGDVNTPTIAQLKKNALFSFRSLADYGDHELTYPIAYATLFTGVNYDKHGYDGQLASSNIAQYPSFIQRIKTRNPNANVGLFTSNEEVGNDFKDGADVYKSSDDDDETIANAVTHLQSEEVDVVVVNLRELEKVGNDVDYDASNPEFLQAIKNFDDQLKLLKQTVESRSNYNREDWMIVVVGTQGANRLLNNAAASAYEDDRRDVFTLFYNKKIVNRPIPTPSVSQIPFSGVSPVYNGSAADNNVAVLANDNGLYNFKTEDFTIKFSMKGSGVSTSYPLFLSKSAAINTSTPGWKLFLAGQKLSMQAGNGSGWFNWETDLIVNDDKWHNVAIVFYRENGTRYVKMFVDGVRSSEVRSINNVSSFENNEPIRIGRNGAHADIPNFQINHLQFYNKAWTDVEIQAESCKVEVDSESTNYENLVGYWPANEGGGTRLKNHAPNATNKDFILQGKYSWQLFSDVTDNLCPLINNSYYTIVPNGVDIPYTILSWMGVPIATHWKLEGRVWEFSFNNIKP